MLQRRAPAGEGQCTGRVIVQDGPLRRGRATAARGHDSEGPVQGAATVQERPLYRQGHRRKAFIRGCATVREGRCRKGRVVKEGATVGRISRRKEH